MYLCPEEIRMYEFFLQFSFSLSLYFSPPPLSLSPSPNLTVYLTGWMPCAIGNLCGDALRLDESESGGGVEAGEKKGGERRRGDGESRVRTIFMLLEF